MFSYLIAKVGTKSQKTFSQPGRLAGGDKAYFLEVKINILKISTGKIARNGIHNRWAKPTLVPLLVSPASTTLSTTSDTTLSVTHSTTPEYHPYLPPFIPPKVTPLVPPPLPPLVPRVVPQLEVIPLGPLLQINGK